MPTLAVNGGDGDDRVMGDAGIDHVNGDAGNDRVFAGTGFADELDGGPGFDYCVGRNMGGSSSAAGRTFTMYTRIRNMHPVTGIVIGVVATLALSGTAMAITDTSFTYSTVQTGYLMIGPGDLVPEDNADATDYYLDDFGEATSGGGVCFVGPVHLPHGARITSVRTSYKSGVSSTPYLSLVRANPLTGALDLLIGHHIADDSGTRKFVNDAVPAYGLVSNGLYSYTYRVCLGPNDSFYGARIAYQYTNAGD